MKNDIKSFIKPSKDFAKDRKGYQAKFDLEHNSVKKDLDSLLSFNKLYSNDRKVYNNLIHNRTEKVSKEVKFPSREIQEVSPIDDLIVELTEELDNLNF